MCIFCLSIWSLSLWPSELLLFWCSWLGPRWMFSILGFFFFTFPLKFWRLFSLFVCLPVFQFSIFNFQFLIFNQLMFCLYLHWLWFLTTVLYLHFVYLRMFFISISLYCHWIFRMLFRREVFSIGRKSLWNFCFYTFYIHYSLYYLPSFLWLGFQFIFCWIALRYSSGCPQTLPIPLRGPGCKLRGPLGSISMVPPPLI